jgi:hypothetical protein
MAKPTLHLIALPFLDEMQIAHAASCTRLTPKSFVMANTLVTIGHVGGRPYSRYDINEFVRTYSRRDGWRGAIGLYQSMLKEGPEIKALAEHLD